MNNCSVIRDLLPLYMDQEISAEGAALVKQHLADCPECREYYRQLGHIAHALKTPPKSNRYQYSVLAQRIRHRNQVLFTTGCTAALVLGYLIGKKLTSERG